MGRTKVTARKSYGGKAPKRLPPAPEPSSPVDSTAAADTVSLDTADKADELDKQHTESTAEAIPEDSGQSRQKREVALTPAESEQRGIKRERELDDFEAGGKGLENVIQKGEDIKEEDIKEEDISEEDGGVETQSNVDRIKSLKRRKVEIENEITRLEAIESTRLSIVKLEKEIEELEGQHLSNQGEAK
ncbi:hypothetical protein JCM3765_006577 [Sporobolomyces pararoseus]